MGSNVRIRDPGLWTDGSTLLATELESFDASMFRQLDGDNGGAWAPTSPIEIGGLGLSVTGPSAFGDITAATLNGTLTVSSGNGITFASGATLTMSTGSTATAAGTTTITLSGTASLALTGNATIDTGATATAEFDGAVSLTATATMSFDNTSTIDFGGVKATGAITRTGQTILSGQAAFGWRSTSLSDADTSLDAGSYDVVFLTASLTTADRNITLKKPTNNIHAKCLLTRQSAAGSKIYKIRNHDGTELYSFAASGSPWVEMYFNGTDWVVCRFGAGT